MDLPHLLLSTKSSPTSLIPSCVSNCLLWLPHLSSPNSRVSKRSSPQNFLLPHIHYQNPLHSRHSQENSKVILAKDIGRLSKDIHLLFLKFILSVSTPFLHQTTCGTHIFSFPSPVDYTDFLFQPSSPFLL